MKDSKKKMMELLKWMLLAGVGGFAGTCLRFLGGKLFHWITPSALFPWSTFLVNALGALLIGIFYGLAERHQLLSPAMSALLITGFCGGLTTFSSFANDLWVLCDGRHFGLVVLYLILSLLVGVGMVILGRYWVR